MSGGETSQAVAQIAQLATRARRAELQAMLVEKFGWTVQAGPFAGMMLPARADSGDGELLAKLLGCFEADLHPVIESLLQARPGLVVDIGAGEGYYAVGLARMLSDARVHAFDDTPAAADLCRETARLNGVEHIVSVAGSCSPVLLQHLLVRAAKPWLLCDCEGAEQTLLDPQQTPALAVTTLVVECHDFIAGSITQTLAQRLSPTHDLSAVREGARDPNAIEFLQPLDSLDRWIAVCEYRPCTMHWLIATPKAA